jgi:hypothetical protein
MMTGNRSILFYCTPNSPKIRLLAKVWKVQIILPCGCYFKKEVTNVKSAKLTFLQTLN